MIEKITGHSYRSMLRYGINYLDKHRAIVNDLNVFPVPDGDTGTNMVMTMKNGYQSINTEADSIAAVSHSFANAAVFGARGNSGVIVSQFFKGISEGFREVEDADSLAFSKALDMGCSFAYAAVAKPVEGTILTVLRDATNAVMQRITELIALFLKEASRSLKNTPNLLPILQKAGVVDSGGAGIVYFFEGMQRYLNGEELETVENATEEAPAVDYSKFNKDTKFEYGYCTETLLQLTTDTADFDYPAFCEELKGYGDSIVTSLEGDKVKLHIHTKHPENALAFCHRYGEFLSLKIENMSVQHSEITPPAPKLLCAPSSGTGLFATVAVAPNAMLQKMLSDMGADVVIMSENVPASQDFIEAFECINAKHILVFPNSSNSILSAMQAGSLHKGAQVTVLNCRSIAECYPALAIIDYGSNDLQSVISDINETIHNIYEVSVVHASKNIKYGNKTITKNDYFALAGNDVLYTGHQFNSVVTETVKAVAKERDCAVITMFYGQNVTEDTVEALAACIGEAYPDVDVCHIPTQNPIYDLILSFE